MSSTEAEINDAIEALTSPARERRLAASLDMRGLCPADCYWQTEEEQQALDRLQLELIRVQPTTEQIRERVAQKRAARLASGEKS
jgi:hypothetical protein